MYKVPISLLVDLHNTMKSSRKIIKSKVKDKASTLCFVKKNIDDLERLISIIEENYNID